MGIVKDKEAWASNLRYVSDAREIDQAVDRAKDAIQHLLTTRVWTDDEKELLGEMKRAGSATKLVYAFSLSEVGDLLSQWRAYCPPSGGYAIGFPSTQLRRTAEKQEFFLCRCVYEDALVYQIVSEFIEAFVEQYRVRRAAGEVLGQLIQNIAWQFDQHLALFGAVIKHNSFQEEREWRLFCRVWEHPQLDFRATRKGILPFFRFRLADDEHPNLARSGDDMLTVVVGPTGNLGDAQIAIQLMLMKYLPGAGHSSTATPYRTW